MKFRKKSRIFKPKHNAQLLKLLARRPAKRGKPVNTSKVRATLPQQEAGQSEQHVNWSIQHAGKPKKQEEPTIEFKHAKLNYLIHAQKNQYCLLKS